MDHEPIRLLVRDGGFDSKWNRNPGASFNREGAVDWVDWPSSKPGSCVVGRRARAADRAPGPARAERPDIESSKHRDSIAIDWCS